MEVHWSDLTAEWLMIKCCRCTIILPEKLPYYFELYMYKRANNNQSNLALRANPFPKVTDPVQESKQKSVQPGP